MTNRILKHLEAIVETGSVLAASRKLFISQPSLSQYVKRVEADYEITIFDRSTSPWTLTPEGRALIDAQRRIEVIDRECRQFFADRRGLLAGEIRIASTAYRTATLLNPVLGRYKRAHPAIVVNIIEGTTAEAADMVENGRADCGYVITSMVPPGLERMHIYAEKVLLALPPSHPWMIEHAIDTSVIHPCPDLKNFDGSMFITMQRGQVFHQYYEDLCRRFAIELPIALETQSILTVPALIESGLGCALVPSTIAQDCMARGLGLFTLEGILPINAVSLAWSRTRYRSHALERFIEMCRPQDGAAAGA